MSDVLDHHHHRPSIWHDRPPTYERLLVDTLVDIRRNAHKHALLNSSRANVHRQPPSPLTPSSDRLSIHSDGTFDIDLKSIWSQKTIESSLASSSSRSHTPTEQYDPSRPRSPGDESFFPTPVSPTSFFADEEDDDEEEYDESLDLDLELMAAPDFDEPAPAYDAASGSGSTSTSISTSHVPITRTSPAHISTPTPTPANPSNHLHQQSPSSTSTRFDPALLAELEDEDPWTAFAALCWARCVYDEPRNPPPHAFGRHTTLARDASSSTSTDVAETTALDLEYEPQPEPEPEPETETESAPSLLPVRRSPFPYPSAFSRTEPDLTVGVWKAGDGDGERYDDGDGDGEGGRRDNALAFALGLEDDLSADFDLDYTLDSRPLRPPRTRTPGLAPSQAVVHKLEYVPPRAPSPPRRLHKFNAADLPVFAPAPTHAHAHSRSSSGGGIKRLWPWRAREVLPVQTHAAY